MLNISTSLSQISEIVYQLTEKNKQYAVLHASIQNEPLYLSLEVKLQQFNVHIVSSSYIDIYLENDAQVAFFTELDAFNKTTIRNKGQELFGTKKPIPEQIIENYEHILCKKKNESRFFIRIAIPNKEPFFNRITRQMQHGEILQETSESLNDLTPFETSTQTVVIEYRGLRFGQQNFFADCKFAYLLETVEKVNEFTEILPEELDQLENIQLDKSIYESSQSPPPSQSSQPVSTFKDNLRCNFSFLEEDDTPSPIDPRDERRKLAQQKHQKYLEHLEQLKKIVEVDVENMLRKRDDLNVKYLDALEEHKRIDTPSYQYNTDDELLEEEAEEYSVHLMV